MRKDAKGQVASSVAAKDELEISAYKEHAPAIGWMVMNWSLLEAVFDRHLMRALIPLEPGELCNVVTSNIDFQAKIQIALKVGHLKKPDDKWFSELEKALNWIDNDLRPMRNRCIHDPIVTQLKHPYPAVRADSRATLKKPQSHQPRELTTYSETPISPDDIWKLADNIAVATKTIGLLAGRFRKSRQATSPEK